jgi:hypothetical protein
MIDDGHDRCRAPIATSRRRLPMVTGGDRQDTNGLTPLERAYRNERSVGACYLQGRQLGSDDCVDRLLGGSGGCAVEHRARLHSVLDRRVSNAVVGMCEQRRCVDQFVEADSVPVMPTTGHRPLSVGRRHSKSPAIYLPGGYQVRCTGPDSRPPTVLQTFAPGACWLFPRSSHARRSVDCHGVDHEDDRR